VEFADCSVEAWTERFPIRGEFRISRGSKTEAEVVVCRITSGGRAGYGECVPYTRYGERSIRSLRQSEKAAAASAAISNTTP
jgi:L-alanine-DL-glutamate epimerase-like enolase superfamily enzyme